MSMHLHARRQVVGPDSGASVEFAGLLDPIRTTFEVADVTAAGDVVDVVDVGLADVLPEAVPEIVEAQAVDPVAVSRFADAGIDDDRLPLHAAAKRFRLR